MTKDLIELRKEIDDVDNSLLELLLKRMKVVEGVIEYKERNGLPVLDEKREQTILNKKREQAQEFGLSADFVEDLYKLLMKESKRIQREIKNKK